MSLHLGLSLRTGDKVKAEVSLCFVCSLQTIGYTWGKQIRTRHPHSRCGPWMMVGLLAPFELSNTSGKRPGDSQIPPVYVSVHLYNKNSISFEILSVGGVSTLFSEHPCLSRISSHLLDTFLNLKKISCCIIFPSVLMDWTCFIILPYLIIFVLKRIFHYDKLIGIWDAINRFIFTLFMLNDGMCDPSPFPHPSQHFNDFISYYTKWFDSNEVKPSSQ